MSHSRRTPCCESEAIRYLQEETLLTTGKDGFWFSVASLTAAIETLAHGKCCWEPQDDATAIIKAAKEAERE